MSQTTGVVQPSYKGAQDDFNRQVNEGWMKMTEKNENYPIRMMPAFKIVNGEPRYISQVKKHWNVPVPGTDDTYTFTCPRSKGEACFICDLKDTLRATLPKASKFLEPSLSIMVAVVDVNNPSAGVLRLVEGRTFFEMIQKTVKRLPLVCDPEQGQVLNVEKLGKPPWRSIIPGEVMPLSSLGLSNDVARIENLLDLDAEWEFMDYDDQKEKFAELLTNPQLILGEAAKSAPPPAQAQNAAPYQAPVTSSAPQPATMTENSPAAQALREKMEQAAQEGGG